MEKHIILVLFDVLADICVSTTSVECSALKDLLMAQKRTDKLYERATEVFLSKEKMEFIFKWADAAAVRQQSAVDWTNQSS